MHERNNGNIFQFFVNFNWICKNHDYREKFENDISEFWAFFTIFGLNVTKLYTVKMRIEFFKRCVAELFQIVVKFYKDIILMWKKNVENSI